MSVNQALAAIKPVYLRWQNPGNAEPIVEIPTNYIKFERALCEQYEHLFESDSSYAYVASRTTPGDLAAQITGGLKSGGASKDGKAVKTVCKMLGIKHTYKAIREYLKA